MCTDSPAHMEMSPEIAPRDIFGLLVTGAAGRAASSSRSFVRFLVPAKEIGKSHDYYLQIIFSGCFALCTYHFTQYFQPHKYALFYYIVTFL